MISKANIISIHKLKQEVHESVKHHYEEAERLVNQCNSDECVKVEIKISLLLNKYYLEFTIININHIDHNITHKSICYFIK